ncbi:MAG: hypothetical protein OSB00_01315 [Sphingomonas bacterium]|nr:hypothetical protein [Sphingomonas bacterium]
MAEDNSTESSTEGSVADNNALGFGGERDRGERVPNAAGARDAPVEPASAGTGNDYQRRRSMDAGDLPEGMEARYLVERRRLLGEQRYYENASDAKPAFRDKGDRLIADNNSRDLIRDMVDIAEHRGWDRITVSGSEEFRREVWRAAALRGIDVDGYKPKPREVQEIGRTRDQQDTRANAIAPGGTDPRPRRSAREASDSPPDAVDAPGVTKGPGPARADFAVGVSGRLSDVGEAHYGGKPGAKITPYADIVLADGRQERAWGVGLPTALREAGVGVGDEVLLRRLGTERVQVTIGVLNPETGERSSEVRDVNRNRWSAEQILTPEIHEARRTTDATGERPPREAGIDAGRATPDNVAVERMRTKIRPDDDGMVERASNPGDEVLGVRTAPTRDTLDRATAEPTVDRTPSVERTEVGSRATIPRRDDDPVTPSPAAHTIKKENQDQSRAIESLSRGDSGGRGSTGDRDDRARQLADRFRNASSAEAARDPELRAAQSQFIAAKAIVTSTLGHNPAAANRLISQSRETLAKALEQGKRIPSAELRSERTVEAERSRSRPERLRGHPDPAETTTVTKTPTRGRGR